MISKEELRLEITVRIMSFVVSFVNHSRLDSTGKCRSRKLFDISSSVRGHEVKGVRNEGCMWWGRKWEGEE